MFEPKTLEDYSMQGITPSEEDLLRQRLAYAHSKPGLMSIEMARVAARRRMVDAARRGDPYPPTDHGLEVAKAFGLAAILSIVCFWAPLTATLVVLFQ